MIILLMLAVSYFSSLQVRWDDIEAAKHNRVSPWEIEPSGSVSTSNNMMAAGLKRTRIGSTSAKLEFPVPSKSEDFFLLIYELSYLMQQY